MDQFPPRINETVHERSMYKNTTYLHKPHNLGSTGEPKYSITNLQGLIEKQSATKTKNAANFNVCCRSFLMTATYLKKQIKANRKGNKHIFPSWAAITFPRQSTGRLFYLTLASISVITNLMQLPTMV